MRNQKWDGTDVSADLSSEAPGEGGGHPSLRNDIDFDRGRESAGSPSLRTGQALFTHPALQLMGSNSETEVFEF